MVKTSATTTIHSSASGRQHLQITSAARVLTAFGHDQINGPTRLGQHLQQQQQGNIDCKDAVRYTL